MARSRGNPVALVSAGLDVLAGGPVAEAVKGFEEVTGVMKSFVAALNPAAVQFFDQALGNLNATIGQAFLPVIQTLTGVLQDAAGALDAPFRALAPVFERLAGLAASVIVPIVQYLGVLLEALAPALDLLTTLLAPLADVLRVNVAWMTAWATVLKGVFDGLTPVVEQVTAALRDMIRATVVATVYVAKAFGLNKLLDAFQAALGRQGEPERVSNLAPQNVRVAALDAIVKDLATSAALAGAGEKPRQTDEWLAQLAGDVKAARDDTRDFSQVLHDWIVKDLPDAIYQVLEKFRHLGTGLANDAAQAAGVDTGTTGGRMARDILASNLTPFGNVTAAADALRAMAR